MDITYMLNESGEKILLDLNSINKIPLEIFQDGYYGYVYDIISTMCKYYSTLNAISVFENYKENSLCRLELKNFYEELKYFEEKMDDLLYNHRIYK